MQIKYVYRPIDGALFASCKTAPILPPDPDDLELASHDNATWDAWASCFNAIACIAKLQQGQSCKDSEAVKP